MGQKFSRIGPYIKKVLQEVLSIPAFVAANHNIYHHKRWPAFYMSRAWHAFLTVILRGLCYQKQHSLFLMRTNAQGRDVMQYKFKQHSDALWRKYNPVTVSFQEAPTWQQPSFNHSMKVWPKKNCGTILCGLRNHFQTLYIQIHHNIVAWCSGSTWFFFLSKICWMI